MDIKAFLKVLNKYKWLLILVPITAAVITFFLVKNLPKEYSSEAQIATGLVDQSKQVVGAGTQNADYFKINQQFSNIIERMKMRRIMSILSYHLILHDLENPKEAFKPYSPKLDSLNNNQRQELIQIFNEKLQQKSVVTILDNKGKFKLYDILSSMGYNKEDIEKKLNIYRPDNSDFINVNYVSENPKLSAFVVNTLALEFINNYGRDVNTNQNNSIQLLDSLLKKKEGTMNDKNAALKEFKMRNGVLNLDKQSEIVYTQISANEERKAQAIREIQANLMAIADIDAKLNGRSGDSFSQGNSTVDNRAIVNLKNQLKEANDAYIDGNFKVSDKKRIDSLSRLIDRLSSRISDGDVTNPIASRQGLIQQKLALQTAVSQAKGSIKSIDNELAMLKAKYNSMVPFDAGIQNYERDAELATKDYMASLDSYNQTRTEQNIALKLQLAQVGLEGPPMPSKGIIYIGLAGIASFFICFVAILIIFLLDNTIRDSRQLEAATSSRVLGSLNYMHDADLSMRNVWNDNKNNPEYTAYRDLLRSLRFEISNAFESDDTKILGVTSLNDKEGKSFIASSLAYSFAMIGKKVLLIGGETEVVKSNSKELSLSQDFETFLVKRQIQTEDLITVLNKNDNNSSLLEMQNAKNLRAGFEVLRNEFDVIIIDVNSLHDINIAKEWLLFTEKNIAVFESGKSLEDRDKELIAYIKDQPGFLGWVLNKIQLKKIK
ncbi:Wzz/FepE/Etk N-terminal domain-containing protein [Pedobacter gandavensis]|uniref:exopolysaccharide transport family protein n=1 Tax=Pedobacter TaxID=84567 RepID=UPI001C99530A|nr:MULTISPECIES: Wzz/FepE/Etk N-terminal domain-containing protein [Pedobacter]WGQ11096.1 Wzz/FepE/Etk N-terminal domain-containing protein [Pedobacter gandavensis]